jgi:hypothetical protein
MVALENLLWTAPRRQADSGGHKFYNKLCGVVMDTWWMILGASFAPSLGGNVFLLIGK